MSNLAKKSQGTKVYIGTTASDEGADTFTEIKEIKQIGEFGSEASIIDATALADAAKYKLKGTPDNGNVELSGNRAHTDAGQTALKAAADDVGDDPYNFRIVFSDKVTGGGTGTTIKFKAIVTSFKTGVGGVDGLLGFVSQVAVTGLVTEQAAT
jgi:hypothetical protein